MNHVAADRTVTDSNVHILSTGLCTFLHNKSLGPTAVEIPLLLYDRYSSVTGDDIPPHEAFLVTSEDYDIIDKSGNPWVTTENGYRIVYLGYLGLDQMSVRGAQGRVRATEIDRQDNCPDGETANMYWVPRMSRVLKTYSPEQPIPLAARLQLAGGDIQAYVVDGYIWEFKEKSGGAYHTQAIAQIVDWEFRMGGALMIDFGPPSDGRFISIRSAVDPIVVVIGSAPDIAAVVTRKSTHRHYDSDPHFETYYDRVGGKPPIRIPFVKHDSEGKEVRCAVAAPPNFIPKWLLAGAEIVGSVNCGPDQWP
jgi:hypothetical protein